MVFGTSPSLPLAVPLVVEVTRWLTNMLLGSEERMLIIVRVGLIRPTFEKKSSYNTTVPQLTGGHTTLANVAIPRSELCTCVLR